MVKIINNNEFIIINLILTFISSLSIIIYSSNKKNLYPVKNIKLGSLLIIYFMNFCNCSNIIYTNTTRGST